METALNPTFKEIQKFKRNGLWATLVVAALLVIGSFGLAFYVQIIRGIKFGNHPAGDVELIIVSIISVMITSYPILLFEIAKLITEIDEHGIHYKFFHFTANFDMSVGIQLISIMSCRLSKGTNMWGINLEEKHMI